MSEYQDALDQVLQDARKSLSTLSHEELVEECANQRATIIQMIGLVKGAHSAAVEFGRGESASHLFLLLMDISGLAGYDFIQSDDTEAGV